MMEELQKLRQEIDEIDAQLTQLFLQRMDVTARVGTYKLGRDMAVLDPERERQAVEHRSEQGNTPMKKAEIAAFYGGIMGISRRQQRRLISASERQSAPQSTEKASAPCRPPVSNPRVVYQGEPGAYSEAAVMGYFGHEIQRQGLPRFEDSFLALQNGTADYALLPIENSSTGSIRQVYDLLSQYEYHIVGEWQVKVEHCLMALPGVTVDEIERVYSHEQGLMQCEQFLAQYPQWQAIPTLDTAGSAKEVAARGERTDAAICSRRAAEIYGLEILAEKVNFKAENVTRFVIISPVHERRDHCNKVSVLFTLRHQSGSLHEIMTLFAAAGLNLVKLESRPLPNRNWSYQFFADFTGQLDDPAVAEVLEELSLSAEMCRILGNYQDMDSAKML